MSDCDAPAGRGTTPGHVNGDGGLVFSGEFDAFARTLSDGSMHVDLMVPGMKCAGCIAKVEGVLNTLEGVTSARVNLSTGRVAVDWIAGEATVGEVVEAVKNTGYDVRPFDAGAIAAGQRDGESRMLLRSLAVSGFAAANIMLLSVSVWSGAGDATRDLFHWLSAVIAVPAVVYGGRPFFVSALGVLRNGSLNMDVPISLAVVLALGLSLFETMTRGEQAYFDASVTLLFFLLVGRYLDSVMRARTRSAVQQMMRLMSQTAVVESPDGTTRSVCVAGVAVGDVVVVAVGERIPVDGVVTKGASDVDVSLLTGESEPETVRPGGQVYSGTLNLTAPVRVETRATGADTFLADVVRLMETAESRKARYMRWADRAARIYAPVVHVAAALTFLGWMWCSGGDWHVAMIAAISVLIITCPCALGLAVPAVQVVASGVLFRRGILVKDGSALERLSEIDTVVFDKTGTLTQGEPRFCPQADIDDGLIAIAAGLAGNSRHPLSRAMTNLALARNVVPREIECVREIPGSGLEGLFDGQRVRLGKPVWCGGGNAENVTDARLQLCLSIDDGPTEMFLFEDALRPCAASTVSALKGQGLRVEILSGDSGPAVSVVAGILDVDSYTAEATPQQKLDRLAELSRQGRRVLMVGDGLNDAPALAAGHASMAPSEASEVGRTASDFVFLGNGLDAVQVAIGVANQSRRLIRQNFTLAVLYNMIAVPVAAMGLASPLVAALAMSGSSLAVTANALRLRLSARVSGDRTTRSAQTRAYTGRGVKPVSTARVDERREAYP